MLEDHINFIDDLQREIISQEVSYQDLESLNKNRTTKDCILYVNICSLNANFENLQIFIKRLKIKPSVIICSESWIQTHVDTFKIDGYNLYYNSSTINKADGVVVYIADYINEDTDIIEIGKLKILHTSITLNNNCKLEISSVYRSHDLPCPEFNSNIKTFLSLTKHLKITLL